MESLSKRTLAVVSGVRGFLMLASCSVGNSSPNEEASLGPEMTCTPVEPERWEQPTPASMMIPEVLDLSEFRMGEATCEKAVSLEETLAGKIVAVKDISNECIVSGFMLPPKSETSQGSKKILALCYVGQQAPQPIEA